MNKLFLSLVTVALLIASWTTSVQSQSSELEEWLLSIEREELGGREMNEILRERDEFGATGGPTGTGGSTTDDGGGGDTPCTDNLDCISTAECVFAYCDDGTGTCAHEVTPTSATCACVSESDNCTDPSQSPFEVDQVLTAGNEGMIVISAKDSNGNPKLTGGLSFTAFFDCVSNCGKRSVSIVDVGTSEDQQNGTYIIRFTPYRATSFDLHVKIDSFDILGSPQTVTVGAGKISAPKSFVSDAPEFPIATTQNYTFIVTLRDDYSNNVPDRANEIFVDVSGPEGASGFSSVVFLDNGTYAVEFGVPQQGNFTVSVQVGGKDITNSPFSALFVPPTATAPQNSFAVGSGVENGTAGAKRQITIFAKDQNNASRTSGGDDFEIVINWGVDGERRITPQDKGDGTYTATYNLTVAGPYSLTITYEGYPISGSPYNFEITPGAAHGPSCVATSLDDGMVEEVRSFNVTAFDQYGNQITDGSVTIVIDVTYPIGASEVLKNMTTVDIFSGEVYTVDFTGYAVGTYSIAVFVDGAHIKDSPFSLTLTPLPAPVPLSAIIQKNGVRMNIDFDVSTNQANMEDFQECDVVIDVNKTPYLGDGATCGWISDTTLQVKLGAQAGLVQDDQITFKKDTIRTVHSNSFAVTAKVNVTIDNPIPDPVAVITGPKLIGVCDPLKLSALQSTGGMGRPMTYQWTSTLFFNDSIITNDSTIVIPSEVMDQPSFVVNVTVTNWLNAFGSSSITITKADVPLPLIQIQNFDPVTMYRSDAQRLQGSAAFSACATDKVLNFQWQVISGPSFNDSNLDYTQRELKIPKSTLPVGTYIFKLTGAQASNTTLQSSTTITVIVLPSNPTTMIAGGSRVIGTMNPFRLDAYSKSKDNDMAGDLSFSWTCWDQIQNVTCPFSLPNSGFIDMAPGSVDPGMYTFTVTATSVNGLTSTDTVNINVVFGNPPAVSVAPGYVVKASSSNRVSLLGTILPSSNNTLTQKWMSIPKSAFSIDQDTSASADIDTGINLILKPDTLVPGKTYTFRLTANEEGNAPGYAEHTFTVNSAPGGGIITADKRTGDAYVDTFTFTSTGWADDASDFPLEYQFTYLPRNQKKKASLAQEALLGTRTLTPSVSTFFAPGNYTIFVRAYDKFGAFALASVDISVNSVPIPDPGAFFGSLLTGSVADALAAGDRGAALAQVGTVANAMAEQENMDATAKDNLVGMLLDVACPTSTKGGDPSEAAMSGQTLSATTDPNGSNRADQLGNCMGNLMGGLELPDNTVMDTNTASNFAQVVGSLFSSSTSTKKRMSAADVVSAVDQLHTLQTGNRFCGELGVSTAGDTFELFSQLATIKQVKTSSGLFAFVSGSLNFDDTVSIPTTDCYNLKMYAVPTDITPDSVNTTLISGVLVAAISPNLDSQQDSKPVTIQIPITGSYDHDTEVIKCVTRSDWGQDWSTTACSTVSFNTSYAVCSCSALGQFSATKTAKPDTSGSTTGVVSTTTSSSGQSSSDKSGESNLFPVAAVVVPVVVVGAAAVGIVAFLVVKRKSTTKVQRIEEGSGRPWNE